VQKFTNEGAMFLIIILKMNLCSVFQVRIYYDNIDAGIREEKGWIDKLLNSYMTILDKETTVHSSRVFSIRKYFLLFLTSKLT